MAVALARVRVPLLWASLVFVVVATFSDVPWWAPLLALIVAFAVYTRIGTVRRPPIEVGFPVRGRYRAINTPADKVPSHGLHAYGQTYAIDLLHVPSGDGAITMRFWPLTRPAADFPGFGQPVVAPVDGAVVRVHDRARDHRDRTSWAALLYLLTIEAFAREARGPKAILGNHVVVRTPEGHYAVVAHLQRNSVRVRPGDDVRRGDTLAACGNSGNSSEPHVHFQLMDHPQPALAAGLPIVFDRDEADDHRGPGVPTSARPFVAGQPGHVAAAGDGSGTAGATPV